MPVDLAVILALIEKGIAIEEKISSEIKKEKDARKRKKLRKACKRRDRDAIRAVLFDL